MLRLNSNSNVDLYRDPSFIEARGKWATNRLPVQGSGCDRKRQPIASHTHNELFRFKSSHKISARQVLAKFDDASTTGAIVHRESLQTGTCVCGPDIPPRDLLGCIVDVLNHTKDITTTGTCTYKQLYYPADLPSEEEINESIIPSSTTLFFSMKPLEPHWYSIELFDTIVDELREENGIIDGNTTPDNSEGVDSVDVHVIETSKSSFDYFCVLPQCSLPTSSYLQYDKLLKIFTEEEIGHPITSSIVVVNELSEFHLQFKALDRFAVTSQLLKSTLNSECHHMIHGEVLSLAITISDASKSKALFCLSSSVQALKSCYFPHGNDLIAVNLEKMGDLYLEGLEDLDYLSRSSSSLSTRVAFSDDSILQTSRDKEFLTLKKLRQPNSEALNKSIKPKVDMTALSSLHSKYIIYQSPPGPALVVSKAPGVSVEFKHYFQLRPVVFVEPKASILKLKTNDFNYYESRGIDNYADNSCTLRHGKSKSFLDASLYCITKPRECPSKRDPNHANDAQQNLLAGATASNGGREMLNSNSSNSKPACQADNSQEKANISYYEPLGSRLDNEKDRQVISLPLCPSSSPVILVGLPHSDQDSNPGKNHAEEHETLTAANHHSRRDRASPQYQLSKNTKSPATLSNIARSSAHLLSLSNNRNKNNSINDKVKEYLKVHSKSAASNSNSNSNSNSSSTSNNSTFYHQENRNPNLDFESNIDCSKSANDPIKRLYESSESLNSLKKTHHSSGVTSSRGSVAGGSSRLPVLCSEVILESYSNTLLYELSNRFNVEAIDCFIGSPMSFIVSTSAAISFVSLQCFDSNNMDNFRKYLKELISQAYRYQRIYVIVIGIELHEKCDVSFSKLLFYHGIARVPCDIVLREVQNNGTDIAEIIFSIASHEKTFQNSGFNNACLDVIRNQGNDKKIALSLKLLQSLPTVNIYLGATLLHEHTMNVVDIFKSATLLKEFQDIGEGGSGGRGGGAGEEGGTSKGSCNSGGNNTNINHAWQLKVVSYITTQAHIGLLL